MNKFLKNLTGKLVRILTLLYVNSWLISLGVITFNVIFNHWSPWWFTFAPTFLIVFTVVSINKRFTWFRYLTWAFFREQYICKFKKISPLAGYPMIIWLELEAKPIFIKEGASGFYAAMHKKTAALEQAYGDVFGIIPESDNVTATKTPVVLPSNN